MLTFHTIPAPAPTGDRRPALQEISSIGDAEAVSKLPAMLQRALGGPAQVIPNFNSILRGNRIYPCIAFCNAYEMGEPNTWANLLWLQHLVRTYGFSEAHTPSIIRGTVALIWGSSETLLEDFHD